MAVASTALDRRLARYRAATRGTAVPQAAVRASPGAIELASRLAEALDAEVVRTPEGVVVRAEPASRQLAVDRERLAALPGQPPPDVPLVCLDTETTGLATAAGTVAFLIGLGWWERDRFRQVQLLLPEHAEERALLTALAAAIPAHAWLVTYNGRGFDWPLLVARYRLAGRSAPPHAGHLDLLPVVRRLFRHRMANARLRTAEAELLGLHRSGDVDGGEIPERYFGFLRGGPAENLVAVVRHNDQDVRSLARLLGHLETALGDAEERAVAPVGDLGGLARAFARERRLEEALACLDMATGRVEVTAAQGGSVPSRRANASPGALVAERPSGEGSWPGEDEWAPAPSPSPPTGSWPPAEPWSSSKLAPPATERWRPSDGRRGRAGSYTIGVRGRPSEEAWAATVRTARPDDAGRATTLPWERRPRTTPAPGLLESDDDSWWSPSRAPDFGGRPRRPAETAPLASPRSAAFDAPWTAERIAAERAHLLRRLGRYAAAVEAWESLAAGPGRLAIVAAIELAKLREHRLRDRVGALSATTHGLALIERRRRLGRLEPSLEADLRRRLARLHRTRPRGTGRSVA